MYPLPSFTAERCPKVGLRIRGASESRAGRTALVEPQGILAKHSRPGITGEPCNAVVEETFGVGQPARAQRRRPAFEPCETILRVAFTKHIEHFQCLVVTL